MELGERLTPNCAEFGVQEGEANFRENLSYLWIFLLFLHICITFAMLRDSHYSDSNITEIVIGGTRWDKDFTGFLSCGCSQWLGQDKKYELLSKHKWNFL